MVSAVVSIGRTTYQREIAHNIRDGDEHGTQRLSDLFILPRFSLFFCGATGGVYQAIRSIVGGSSGHDHLFLK